MQRKYDELHIVFDRYDIPKSLKSATRYLRLGDSYPVPDHSTDTTNISNDEVTVFLSKELLEFSKEN